MNTVGRNLIWLLISQVATWTMSLVVVLVVPHYLGAEGFGQFAFALSYVGFFQLAGGLGTAVFMTREIARDHTLLQTLVVNGVVLKLLAASVLSALAIGLALLLNFDGLVVTLIVIACAGMYFTLWNEVFSSALNGLQRMGKMSAWATITVYVSSLAGIFVLAKGGSVVTYTVVIISAGTITVIANTILVLPLMRWRPRPRLDAGVWRSLIVGGVPLMLLAVFNQIYSTLDVPLLAGLTSTTVVGWYVLAYRWAAIPVFIANAVMGSHLPEMSRLGKEPGREFADLVNRAVKLTLLASTPAAVGLAVVAPQLIELFYEPEFDGAIRPLQILAAQIPITGMDTILATALIASDRLRKYLFVAAGAAIFNPLLCAALIVVTDRVWDNGAIGAAIATALTEVAVMTCAIWLSAAGVMDRSTVSWTLRCTLASLAILPVALIAGGSVITFVTQVGLGVVLFAVAAVVRRVFPLGTIGTVLAQAASMVEARRSRSA
ncbi:MAG: flippase, partial [Ilumatobacteraceae bacterium]